MAAQAYYEPHKLSAGALALLVHAVFFSLLYFGFNWRVRTPPNMVVEMWDKLPDSIPEPTPEVVPVPPAPPVLPPPVIAPKVVEQVLQPKAEIEIKEQKKKKKEKVKKDKKEKPEAKTPPPKPVEKSVQPNPEQQQREAQENERIQELRAKMRAEMDAATQSEVTRYMELISTKISHNIIAPPDLPENAKAEFTVIVLPGGKVADVTLVPGKGSGNAAYDSAAERAIYKSSPLPLPQDASLARMFRELHLSVKP